MAEHDRRKYNEVRPHSRLGYDSPEMFAARICPCPTPRQPNILVIFSDDHAFQAISAYGESRQLINTPQIDRLAHDGMRFNRCLVPNSICGPSRATVLTGTYNHINGFVNNSNRRFDGSQITFPKLLQKSVSVTRSASG